MITYSTTIEDVFRLLSKHAAKNKTIIHECEKRTLSKIKRASVFPFSKEIQGILAHQNLLDFELDTVYDTKYSGRVGANVSQFMPYAQISPDHVIKNVKDFTCTDIDTMIIGHWEAMKSKLKSEDILRDLINQCIKNKIQIYSFDDLSRYSFPDNCIYTPKVTKKDVPPKRMGKLFQYNKPILGIFGTSSKQGKFTLQLQLRQELIKAGYRIGQMGTEPTSELFGFDCTFPMGYHSTVEIQNEETVEYLNMQMQNICEKEPDIILVGCQSGSTIYDYGNLSS